MDLRDCESIRRLVKLFSDPPHQSVEVFSRPLSAFVRIPALLSKEFIAFGIFPALFQGQQSV